MKNLIIEHTQQSPKFTLQTNGDIFIKGVSTPDNVQKAYQPVFDWINELKATKPEHLCLNLEIDYLNTSSSRIFVELLLLLNSFKDYGAIVTIKWYYEDGDEDMRELGEDLEISSRSKFEFIPISHFE